MLVLSRRPEQRIVFPNLDISVEILQIKGNTVRLGVQAPPEVRVLREELHTPAAPGAFQPAAGKHWSHELRGRLNTAMMGLSLVEKQLQAGYEDEAQNTLQAALRALEALERAVSDAARADKQQSAPATRKQLATLLVEDDANEQMLLSSYLRMSGFHVETVQDGCEALEYLATHQHPDFVLMDMRMPRLDGPSTIAAIRQNPAYHNLTVYAVTGSMPNEFNIPTGRSGVDAWFQKPVNPARLVEAMSSAVVAN
ncbi:MAG: response regulator [Planctomycetia bacterium]|nr:response regulator [Planctomycetia bacterium]